jgi:hypothetical protein
MRTLRTTLVAATCVSLLALASMGAAAQSEACTGTLEFSGEPGAEGMTWDSTDPRLSGDAQGSGGWSLYETPSEDAGASTEADASYIIINEDGSWTCADSIPAGPEPDLAGHTLVFSGTGDYEGLTAHVRIDWDTYPFSFSGVIVEGGAPEDPTLAG